MAFPLIPEEFASPFSSLDSTYDHTTPLLPVKLPELYEEVKLEFSKSSKPQKSRAISVKTLD